jgi:hypothetical protein
MLRATAQILNARDTVIAGLSMCFAEIGYNRPTQPVVFQGTSTSLRLAPKSLTRIPSAVWFWCCLMFTKKQGQSPVKIPKIPVQNLTANFFTRTILPFQDTGVNLKTWN